MREPSLILHHSLSSKKEAGMNEISSLDHLYAKVDALSQKFDKMNVNAVTPTPVSPPCKVCGIFGHTSVECQLGSTVESVEQMNFVQYNQRMRQNQNIYKTPQNPFGQTTPPKSLSKVQLGTFIGKLFYESIRATPRA